MAISIDKYVDINSASSGAGSGDSVPAGSSDIQLFRDPASGRYFTPSEYVGTVEKRADGKYYANGAAVNIVTAEVNPVTGGIEFSAAGAALRQTAAKLLDGYHAQRSDNAIRGHILEARAGLTSSDTPTLSGSSTSPESDTSDPAAQVVSMFGSDLTAVSDMTVAQAALGKRWLRGYSLAAYVHSYAGSYLLPASTAAYGSVGNTGLRPADGYGYDGGVPYIDFVIDGDVFYIKIPSGNKFWLWVNDNLIGSTATLGSNFTFSAADSSFSPNIPGHGWTKVKFASIARRSVRIAGNSSAAIGDIKTRSTSTVTPRCACPLEWIHFGDSFSQYTGASCTRIGLTEYMHSAFGRDIDFINVSQGGTSFANALMNQYGGAPVSGRKASFYNQFHLHWKYNNPSIITCLIGHNDATTDLASVSARAVEMFQAMRERWPSALIVAFCANASPGLISSAADVRVENALVSAIQSANAGVLVVRMQAHPIYGAFLRGTGKVGATTGAGNSDLYTGTDGTHPSDAGHKAYGMFMAERLAEVLRDNFLR